MSRNQTIALAIKVEQETARIRLAAKNKELARAHLLRIQILLAQRPIPSSKP